MARGSHILIGAAAAVLIASAPGSAQERGRFGLGVGINSSLIEVTTLLTPTVYVPIEAGEQLLFEPGVGLVRVVQGDETDTYLAVQAGILFIVSGGEDDRVYLGPRIGLIRTSESVAGSTDSESNLTVSGVFGGEFFLRELFSLGGEVGLRYVDVDNGSLLTSSAEFRVRWYFSQ